MKFKTIFRFYAIINRTISVKSGDDHAETERNNRTQVL